MSFNDTKLPGDDITSQDYNDMLDYAATLCTYGIYKKSGLYYARTSERDETPIDPSADCATVLQAAHDALPSTGGAIRFGRGQFDIDADIDVTKPLKLKGQLGMATERIGGVTQVIYGTRINGTADGLNIFNVASDEPVVMEDLLISNTGANYSPTSGSAVRLAGAESSTWNVCSRFTNVRIVGHHIGIDAVAASAFMVNGCYIVLCNTGLKNQNTADADKGDSTICNSTFSCAAGAGVNIHVASGGGLRIFNNKILYGDYGVYFNLTDGKATSNLLIEGNSIENQQERAIYIGFAGSGTFYNFNIVGNQMGCIDASKIYVEVATGGTNDDSGLVADNIFRGSPTSTGAKITTGKNWHFCGNRFSNLTVGINNAGGSNVSAHGNVFNGVSTALSGTISEVNNVEY